MANTPWINSDGLQVRFGTFEGLAGRAGDYRTNTGIKLLEFAVNLVDITSATAGANILDYNSVLDKGALIEKVEVETTVAVTGTNATLNFGLARSDTTTEIDFDGLG